MEDQGTSENIDNASQTPLPVDYNPSPSNYTPGNQGPQPPMGSGYPQPGPGPERFFTSDKLPKLIVIGIVLMFLGAIIMVAVRTPGYPNEYAEKYDGDNDGYMDGDERDDYNQDRETYDTIRDIGVIVGKIIFNIGMLIILLVLLAGGFINRHLDKHIRLAMILSAGLIIAWSGLMT